MASQDVMQQQPTSTGLYRTITSPIPHTVSMFANEIDHAPSGSHSANNSTAFHPPTPISPSRPAPSSDQLDTSSLAGPSSHVHALASVPIPPPPNPRRHRSGVIMSRVRANSSGTSFRTSGNVNTSKSFGDLNMSMSTMPTDGEDRGSDEEDEHAQARRERLGKRVVSEGHRRQSEDEDLGMWDNSARFYHHLHSRPPSRPASRPGSPTLSPVTRSQATSPATSTSASPIYVRRSLTLPQNPNGAGAMSVSLSPNHHFLQTHLPPPFHVEGHSPEHNHNSMMILTPTTQEWRELKEIRRLEGDSESLVDSSSGSGSGTDDSRRSSLADDTSLKSSVLFSRENGLQMPTRPELKTTTSVDYLPREAKHTPDPGSPVLVPPEDLSPERPLFNSVIIAPSPVMPDDSVVPTAPDTPTREGLPLLERTINLNDAEPESSPEIDVDQPITFSNNENGGPARFNSIGRRESLRAIRPVTDRPGIPRVKTKREQQREKLFKELDEELESDARSEPKSAGGVQEFGFGRGLATSSDRLVFHGAPAEASLIEPKSDLFDKTLSKPFVEESEARIKTTAVPPHVSPTQPIKPSPLHASPLNASTGLPTPETPSDSHPPILELPSPQEAEQTASHPLPGSNLDSIRDYARQMAPPHHNLREGERSGTSTPSPPLSPHTGKPRSRRRDTNRISLVAGRVVQPFAVPPSTALPPDRSSPKHSATSLQSFSPFRSPGLGPSKNTGPVPPLFSRFDSNLSIAPSVDAPSECGTPTSETAGGLGGRGIDDYVILKEAGKGAYGLVMRAKVKGPKGDPVGDEVIIKYIIKARILADCWKKHKQLGPIPVEMHVMDQLRHLLYNPPIRPHPWDPARARPPTPLVNQDLTESAPSTPTPDSPRSDSSGSVLGIFSPTQKYIASEIRHSPERGHPNICKLLDFFEDREFYYLVMPRFGTGVDLFDRVESEPDGLEPFEVRSLVGQLADAIRFLHSNGIIHRDIKDENVILDGTGRCQLIDFGSAAHWRPGKRWDTFSGTLHYASPEILRGEMYSGKEQDVWALGVVAYVLLVGETPFSELPDEVLVGLESHSRAEEALSARCGGEHAEEGLEEDGGGRLEDAADLVRRCMEMEPSDRPSAELLCQHRYLRGQGGWTGKKGWSAAGFK